MNMGRQPSSIGSILDTLLKDKGYATACKEWEVVAAWRKIAGERIAEVTDCGRVDEGRLYVKVKSAPWRQELSYLKEELKRSIVRETGCETIEDIVFY